MDQTRRAVASRDFLFGVGTFLFLSLTLAMPSAGSDPPPTLRQEIALWQKEAERLEFLQEQVGVEPDNLQAWDELLDLLERSAERDENLAQIARRRDWASQPELHEDLKSRQTNELFQWTAAAVSAHPDLPDLQLRLLSLQSPEEGFIDTVEALGKEFPDDPAVALCVARVRAETGEAQAGADHLDRFVARHPEDPAAYEARLRFLQETGKAPEALLAVLDGQAQRFLGEPRFREKLLRLAAQAFEDDADVEPWLERLEGEAEDLGERLTFCELLEGRTLQPGCFERLWSEMKDSDLHRKGGTEAARIRAAVLGFVLEQRDLSWLEEILGFLRGKEAVAAWSAVSPTGLGGQLCDELLLALTGGRLGGSELPATGDLLLWARDWERASRVARECGAGGEMEQLWSQLLRSLSPSVLGDPRHPLAGAEAELLRRLRADPKNLEILRILGGDPQRYDRAPRESVLRLWAEHELTAAPALELARFYRSGDRLEEEREALGLALAKEPGNAEARLLLARAVFETGEVELASKLASSVLEDRLATPRHQATARYLLGRIARNQGRMDEAADHLEHYFLRRFTYAGCCPGTTDEALLAHLQQTAKPERLSSYLKARQQALTTFREVAGSSPFYTCARLDCGPFLEVSDQDLKWWALIVERFPGREEAKAHYEALKRPRDRWQNADPELLFDDDSVLAFDPAQLNHLDAMASGDDRPIVRRFESTLVDLGSLDLPSCE